MTDWPTTTLSTKFGTVLLLSNGGKIRVSNNPQYDRDPDRGGSAEVTDLTFRNLPWIVSLWFEVAESGRGTYAFTEETNRYDTAMHRADKPNGKATNNDFAKVLDEVTPSLGDFVNTPEGRLFVAEGALAAAKADHERAASEFNISEKALKDASDKRRETFRAFNRAVSAVNDLRSVKS